jgi:hypothetical protein
MGYASASSPASSGIRAKFLSVYFRQERQEGDRVLETL